MGKNLVEPEQNLAYLGNAAHHPSPLPDLHFKISSQ